MTDALKKYNALGIRIGKAKDRFDLWLNKLPREIVENKIEGWEENIRPVIELQTEAIKLLPSALSPCCNQPMKAVRSSDGKRLLYATCGNCKQKINIFHKSDFKS